MDSELAAYRWDRVLVVAYLSHTDSSPAPSSGGRLDLTDEETEIVRQQLLDVYGRFGPYPQWVFPAPRGGRFTYSSFYEDVWAPAKLQARVDWLGERGYGTAVRESGHKRRLRRLTKSCGSCSTEYELSPRGGRLPANCPRCGSPLVEASRQRLAVLPPTPFDRVTLHTLRRTAKSWLRESGLPVEIVAQRLGHSDGGATLLAHYTAEARAGQMRAALDGLGAGVRSRLRELENPTHVGEEGGPS